MKPENHPNKKQNYKGVVIKLIILLAVVIVAYIPALKADYVWDDNDHLTENPHLLDFAGLKRIWTSSAGVYYPLVLTSFWIMRRFFNLHPFPYHLLNILIHFFNACLIWAVARELKLKGGLLACAIYALHPVHVESVAWITELKNTQSAFFYLLSIWAFLRFYKLHTFKAGANPPPSKKKYRLYAFSLVFFILALLSKTSTVMLPVALILALWWINRSYSLKPALYTIPFFVLSLASSVWTMWEQKYHAGVTGPEWDFTILERILLASRQIWFYLQKLIVPHPLVFIYPRWEADTASILWYIPLAGIIIALLVLFWKRHSWGRGYLLGFGYFGALLFPTLGFIDMYFMRFSFVADHFQYLASIAPIVMFSHLVGKRIESSPGKQKQLVLVICGAILLIFSIITFRQSRSYKDEQTLWKDTIRKNPGCWLAHNNLGEILARRGDMNRAFSHFKEAYELKNDYEAACYNLGTFALIEKDYNRAISFYEKAIRARWDYALAHNNLGNALSGMGRTSEAIEHYKEAARIDPSFPEPYFNLGNTFFKMEKFREAIANYKKTLEIEPRHADAHCNLGVALLELGENKEGAFHLHEATRINPSHAVANRALWEIRKEN